LIYTSKVTVQNATARRKCIESCSLREKTRMAKIMGSNLMRTCSKPNFVASL